MQDTSSETSSRRLTTLSIVVPCYNEKATIRSVIETVLAADSCGLRKEIVIVDDCSRDGTRELLSQLESEYFGTTYGVRSKVFFTNEPGERRRCAYRLR